MTNKKKFTWIVIAFVAVLLVVGGIIGVTYGIPAYRNYQSYQAAEKMLEAGQYEEAKNAFWALGEYKDSADKMNECDYQKAKQLLEEKKYNEAKELFEQLGDYSDSKSQMNACEYGRAAVYFSDKDYEAAQTIYEKLGKYKDCAEKIKACQYGIAGTYLNEKQFAQARKIYKTLGSYEGAEKQLKECDYQEALQYVEDGEYDSAIKLLKSLKNYSDAKKQLITIEWKKAYTEVIYDWTIVKSLCKKKGKYIGQGDDYDYLEEYFSDISYDYYTLKDLDGDKIPELILYSDSTSMTAILTYKSKLQYVATFYNASLNKNNKILEDGLFRGGGDQVDYYLEVFSFNKGKIQNISNAYSMTDSLIDYMVPFDFDDEDDYDDYEDDDYEISYYYYIRGKKINGLDILDSEDDTYKVSESSFKDHYDSLYNNSETFSGMCDTLLSNSELIKKY